MGLIFGPVPSRRLGRSLGVNNIPPKHCTYSCIYCQVGRTAKPEIERRSFYEVEDLVREAVIAAERTRPDYITFVPDGEPTLDMNLGIEAKEIKKRVPFKLAVITNSSLLWKEDVRRDLEIFDLVSLKIDSVSERTWRRINRPHPSLNLERILDGIEHLFDELGGERIITETMLVDGVNAEEGEIERIAGFLTGLSPRVAYLSVPIRPPAEEWVLPPDEEFLLRAHEILSERGLRVELLTGSEGPGFEPGENPREQILGITAVHPLRMDYALELLAKMRCGRELIDELLREGLLVLRRYRGKEFLLRRIR